MIQASVEEQQSTEALDLKTFAKRMRCKREMKHAHASEIGTAQEHSAKARTPYAISDVRIQINGVAVHHASEEKPWKDGIRDFDASDALALAYGRTAK